jgi:hypothetical protein
MIMYIKSQTTRTYRSAMLPLIASVWAYTRHNLKIMTLMMCIEIFLFPVAWMRFRCYDTHTLIYFLQVLHNMTNYTTDSYLMKYL